MILIDGNNSARRMHHVAVSETLGDLKKRFDVDPKPTENELYEYQYMTIHLFFQEILNLQKKYSSDYGDIIVAVDSGNVWRKRLYGDYKGGRKRQKKTDFDKLSDRLFEHIYKIIIYLLKQTRFMVFTDLRLPDGFGVEADDIIAILSQYEKSLICSVDQDFIQLLSPTIRQYHPFQQKMLPTPSKRDVQMWIDINVISGQAKDSIPSIKDHCVLDEKFIDWVNKKYDLEINGEMIEKIENDHRDIMEEYRLEMEAEDEVLIATGVRKIRRNLTAYKNPRFGKDGALKFRNNLESNLKLHERYEKHYVRNMDLLLFDRIPEDVRELINGEYERLKTEHSTKLFNTITFSKELGKFRLYALQDRLGEF